MKPPAPNSDDDNSYSAPAAACAAQILSFLGRIPGPQPLAAITRGAGCTKSLAFRVLHELERAEFVTKLGAQGYELGLGILELGAAVASRSGPAESMRGILKDLSEKTGQTINVGVLRGFDVLFITKQESPRTVVTISHVGRRLPANCSALGKVLLTQLSDEEVLARAPDPLPELTSKTNIDPRVLLEDVQLARERGFATDFESAILGRCAVAIPITLPQLPGEVAALAATASLDEGDQLDESLLNALMRARTLVERALLAREAIDSSPVEVADAEAT